MKKGQLDFFSLPVRLFLMLFILALLVVFIPILNDFIGMAKNSQHSNCVGYNSTVDDTLDYNSSLPTDTTTCLVWTMFVPILVIVVVMGMIAMLFIGGGQQPMPY